MNRTLFLLPAAIICFTGCSHSAEKQENKVKPLTMTDSLKRVVALDTVSMRNVTNEMMLNGRVTFNQEKVAKVYSIFGGNVVEVHAEIGDYVKKGQVLAVIRSGEIADYQKQLDDANHHSLVAKRNLQTAQDMSHSGMASDRDLLQAKQEMANANAEQRRVKEVYNIYHISGNSVYRIKAPVSGFVVDKKVNKDMQIRSDQNEELFTISGLDNVWVMADVYESDISKVNQGAPVRITTLAYPDKEFTGTIDKVYNMLDDESKTMSARIKLRNDHFMLKPGMFANVYVQCQPTGKPMLCIQTKDIIFVNGKQYVVAVQPDKQLKAREVVVSNQQGKYSYVSYGLKEGDVLISQNALLVYNALNVD